MRTQFLLASALSLLGAAAANAQTTDPSWTGAYVGLHGGWNLDNQNVRTTGVDQNNVNAIQANARPNSVVLDRNGGLGGGQIGANFQYGRVVAGLEADISALDSDATAKYTNINGGPSYLSAKLNYLGTVRPRLGYLISPSTLLYGTGGWAYGGAKYSSAFYRPSGEQNFGGSDRYTATGYAAGAGVEHALPVRFLGSSAWTIRAEWLHYDLGKKQINDAAIPGNGAGAYISDFRTRGDELRGGLNLKF
jgi:outer membrane immunogenic protein